MLPCCTYDSSMSPISRKLDIHIVQGYLSKHTAGVNDYYFENMGNVRNFDVHTRRFNFNTPENKFLGFIFYN